MKLKITVPTSLKDIKLSQYQKLLRTTKDIEDADWVNKQMVAIFCDIPDATVKQIAKKDFDGILKTLNKVLEEKGTFQPIIEHNGREYGFIPNLEEITVSEQGDIDSIVNDFQKMDRVMGIMYRPITFKRKDKYVIKDYMEGINIIEQKIQNAKDKQKHHLIPELKMELAIEKERWEKEEASLDLTMDVVNGAMGFFLTLLNDLLTCTQNYIQRQVEHPQTSEILERNGVGIKTFLSSLTETSSSLREYLNLNYMRL